MIFRPHYTSEFRALYDLVQLAVFRQQDNEPPTSPARTRPASLSVQSSVRENRKLWAQEVEQRASKEVDRALRSAKARAQGPDSDDEEWSPWM